MSDLGQRLKNAIEKDILQTKEDYQKMSVQELGQMTLARGQHKGKSFDWAWKNQISYVTWCGSHLKETPDWMAFLVFIQKKTEELEKKKGKPTCQTYQKKDKVKLEAERVAMGIDQFVESDMSSETEDDGWKEVEKASQSSIPNQGLEIQQLAQAVTGLMQMMEQMNLRLQGLENQIDPK